ncbi:MAG: YcxB family protein [Flammeovirgaceae bacterium]|nr:YcxB family protein [Flammeovirgaceae bacterium]MDW8288408.1 YcxB family protein [Flammeovirgaceae bacterium]
MLSIKTKKYQLSPKTYVEIALKSVMQESWWAWTIPAVIILIGMLYYPAFWWCLTTAIVLGVLYVLFWWIQFTAVTQVEQGKMLFDTYFYEINGQHILMKLDNQKGMQITWDKIIRAIQTDTYFVLFLSRGQFVYLPFHIFNNQHEIKVLETILKRRNLLKTETEKS